MFDVVFQGGLAVLPSGPAQVDVGVAGEVIAAIAGPGELEGSEFVEAKGLVLLPGGIDPHVHIATQFGQWHTRDDFRTATIPAAFGGTTSIIEFAIPRRGETAWSALERCRSEARGACVIDYAFHACVTKEGFAESLAELERIRESGVCSVKIFTAYLDSIGLTLDQIQGVLQAAAKADLQVLVHAETAALINAGIADQVGRGMLEPPGHLHSRTARAEADAIETVAAFARREDARVFFVHVSSDEGAAALRQARLDGSGVLGETCVQYLFLDAGVYDRPDGELWICSPPVRERRHQVALWQALREGVLDLVSTDHNCFDRAQKSQFRDDFRKVPNGLPGIEFRLPALMMAVGDGRLEWTDLARLTAEAPARTFGLWPQKGAIAVGADADLVLIDPKGRTDLSGSHMATDYSPFAGLTAPARVLETWLRGRRLISHGEFASEAGIGHELNCSR